MDLFKDLIIFEMANSHQGSVDHGNKIIKEMSRIVRKHNVNGAVKLQFRNLETFIHPSFRNDKANKHINRFLSTKLNYDDFLQLVIAIKNEGIKAISTPFDEDGVDWCINSGIDIIKIASCSANDWPLLEKAVSANKPIIISTGGKTIKEIDKIYNFMVHRNANFAFLHCTSEYPVLKEHIQLNFIDKLKKRYYNIPIGYSGHEDPDNFLIGMLANAKGATIFERHVGLPTDTIKLNSYSMNPNQTEKWVESILESKAICNLKREDTKYIPQTEIDSINSLMRGVYIKKSVLKGELINKNNVFFAMPLQENQMSTSEFQENIIASKNYNDLDPIFEKRIINDQNIGREVIHEAKGMLIEAGIHLGNDYTVELSHHYGLKNFRKTGATIVNLINREYCKKLIIVLPSQSHPQHFHKLKEETFQLLYGDLKLVINDKVTFLNPGDILTVFRGEIHSFSSEKGAIFEEISTTHIKSDSYYLDNAISSKDIMERKTIIENW